MVKYTLSESLMDIIKKERILAAITYYTNINGSLDLDQVAPAILISKFGITIEDAKRLITSLIADNKVQIVT